MDKTAIRNFAIEARKILMKSAITEAGFYGITKDGCKTPIQKGNDFEVYETLAGTENRIYGDDIKRRENLVKAIEEQGFDQVIEETAYTWFNRIIAIRFMEVNNYLPTRVRVLSSETGSGTPDIITQADTVELNLTTYELDKIQTAKRENKYDEAFRILFVKQCNELNDILPGLFEKTNDYMELLLKITYTGDGVVRMLVDTIPEDNFNVETEGQVEIIGWMYQYYNTELKDDTFAKLKKNVKITKERIPAATQLFTPDWIVRYMVENSLGRVWIEHLRALDSSLDEKAKAEEFGWKYYLPEAEQEENVAAQLVEIRQSYKDLTPQDITCIDPCMGSGHILVYMFDVLMDIYRSEGFSEREAVFDILEKNIRGLDIDRRAYQLSYFALMMKARGYNRIFFRGRENIDGERVQAVPQVYAIEESNNVNRNQLKYFGDGLSEIERNDAINQINGLLDQLIDAKEYGSIINIESYNWRLLKKCVKKYSIPGQMDFEMLGIDITSERLTRLVNQSEIMAGNYHAVVTNPPYMGAGGMSEKLSDFSKKNYPNTKSDMSTICMEKCLKLCSNEGFNAMINIPVWMFLSSYEKLRGMLIDDNMFVSMLHFGRGVFGSDFGTTAFVIKKRRIKGYLAKYRKLFEKQGAVDSIDTKEKWFFEQKGEYIVKQENYQAIPGKAIGYSLGKSLLDAFEAGHLVSTEAEVKQGLATGDNNRFLRLWHEVSIEKECFDAANADVAHDSKKKWFPYNKGGAFRKWYGNVEYVVNWENDGYEIKNIRDDKGKLRSRPQNLKFFFRESLTWSKVTIGGFSMRYVPSGAIFDVAGCSLFPHDDYYLMLACMNSCVQSHILSVFSQSVNYEVGQVAALPIIDVGEHRDEIISLSKECVELSKTDWDSFENSWNFKRHVLVRHKGLLSEIYKEWETECEIRFNRLKELEERINEIFIEIYGLEGELSSEVPEEKVTVRKADVRREIKGLISYAVGCLMGRYDVEHDGIKFAGGDFKESKVGLADGVDTDGIIPITDEKYFDDDIVELFSNWLSKTFGEKYLEKNIEFVADTLGNEGVNSKEKLRNYFINDFYEDHCNMYSVTGSGKRPIYWLFDAGKQNGFKCLVYMHRYCPETIGRIRSDYLVNAQNSIENSLKNVEYILQTTSSAVDKAQAQKNRDKYTKQLNELRLYYQAISHVALQKIEIDLDDGVKVNYAKFQGVEVSNEGEKKQTIDLLAKI